MISSLAEFEKIWTPERDSTLKVMAALTDRSLTQAVGPQDRTLGRIAWHLTTTIPEMTSRTGLNLAGPKKDDPTPTSAKDIYDAYAVASQSLLDQIRSNWTDDTLKIEDDMYGERWTRSQTLMAYIVHEIHHRAQMTVLMRQAGLKVPGVYGPAREEWAAYGMPTPEV